MTPSLAYLALGAYVASFALYVWFLYVNHRNLGRAATLLLACGLVLHYRALLDRAHALGTVPYQDLYGSMSLFAWLLALTYLGLETYHRQRSVGPLIVPFVILLLLGATLPASATSVSKLPAHGATFALHVTLNILAYSAFAISFVLSLIYLLQNRVLRGRQPGIIFWRFPALEVLEGMSRSSVMVGLVALGVGIVLGFVWAHRLQGSYFSADPKEIASLGILACYAGYLWLARTTAWRGARASLVCIVNFLLVIFSYTVVNLFLSRYHRYF